MKATLYKELSNEQTPIIVEEGKTIRQSLYGINFENSIIVVNGKIENPEYRLKENDVVMIRITPGAISSTVLAVVAITMAVVAVGVGIYGGVKAYQANKAAKQAQAELEKVKKLTNKSDIDNRPFIRGASNTIAQGNSQPYIIGRHLFTPYLLASPFYQISGTDGKDQYTHIVLECGFNKQIIKKIATDDVIIKSFNDTQPQDGVFNIDNNLFSKDGQIEIVQNGGLFTSLSMLNYQVKSTTRKDQVVRDVDVKNGKGEYLTYTLDAYAKDVDVAITFPYGLYATDSNGNKIETQVAITPQYSLDGGESWASFTFNNNGTKTNLFKKRVSDTELRYIAHHDFTLEDYNTLKVNGQSAILLQLRSNGNVDSAIRNDCYCLYYQSVCFDPQKSTNELVPAKILEDRERAFSTILGIKVKASELNEDKLQKINIITQGVARVWNGTSWSKDKKETRNPAAWALEIETSSSHPASRRDDSELDLESFGAFYEYCQKNNFSFDYVITQNTKKDDILGYIMDVTGACTYYDIYGRRAIAIDEKKENALAVYNPQNIINIQNKKSFGRRTDGLRIKFINSKDDLFLEDTYLVMREINGEALKLSENSIIKDVTATGITEFEHVVKYARRLMAREILRPKTTTIEVGNEGMFFTPLSKILIQDDSLKIGIGNGFIIRSCQWTQNVLSTICFNGKVDFEPNKAYGIIVNCYTDTGIKPLALKVSGNGKTDTLEVLTQVLLSDEVKPDVDNIASFGELNEDGEFNKITTPYLISQIKRTDNGFSLELVNYDEAIYATGTIPEYKSNITPKVTRTTSQIPPDYMTSQEVQELIDAMKSGEMPISLPNAPTNLLAIAEQTKITLSCEVFGAGLSNTISQFLWEIKKGKNEWERIPFSEYYFDREKDGYPEASDFDDWKFRCCVISIYGKTSDWVECGVNTVNYGTWTVTPATITTRVSDRTISLYFGNEQRAVQREQYGEIKYRIQVARYDDYLRNENGELITENGEPKLEYYEPNVNANPYPIRNNNGDVTQGNEQNYRTERKDKYAESYSVYSQTMPLQHQDNAEWFNDIGQAQIGAIDTKYYFKVVAYNATTKSNNVSESRYVSAIACASNLRDIVFANAKEKEAYVPNLSAISANLGEISQGSIAGSNDNYWVLSTKENARLPKEYQGAFRIGGRDKYLIVTPLINSATGQILDYEFALNVGAFEITTEKTKLNSEIVIYNAEISKFDRTRINVGGIYFEHRTNEFIETSGVADGWNVVAKQETSGLNSSFIFSNNNFILTNQDIAERRKLGFDIGKPYLSEFSQVYHFDSNVFNQKGENKLTINQNNKSSLIPVLIDKEGNQFNKNGDYLGKIQSQVLDFEPAILAVAPYSEVARSLFGVFVVRDSGVIQNNSCTVDFWIKYYYSEGQNLCNVGTVQDSISIVCVSGEPNYNEPQSYNTQKEPPYNFEIKYSDRLHYNHAQQYNKGVYIVHQGLSNIEQVKIEDIGEIFNEGEWRHIAVVISSQNISCFVQNHKIDFKRFSTAENEVDITISDNEHSLILDELLIDKTKAQSFESFKETTSNKICWASINYKDNSMIISAKEDKTQKPILKTNLFKSDEFKNAVLGILNSQKG